MRSSLAAVASLLLASIVLLLARAARAETLEAPVGGKGIALGDGIGLGIPLANAGGIAQASFNLHLWFEQRITGTNDVGSSDQALIFGPSISFGNLGASF